MKRTFEKWKKNNKEKEKERERGGRGRGREKRVRRDNQMELIPRILEGTVYRGQLKSFQAHSHQRAGGVRANDLSTSSRSAKWHCPGSYSLQSSKVHLSNW